VAGADVSQHQAFRRVPVQQGALQYTPHTIPAPVKGIVEIENWAYTAPGTAIILNNWFPTQRGIRLRGGTERWAVLPNTADDPPVTEPIRSGLEYVSGSVHRMFAATPTRLFDVSFPDSPVLEFDDLTDGHFGFAQLANMGGDFMLAVNDAGDYVRRYDGVTWVYLDTLAVATWANNVSYAVDDVRRDAELSSVWRCLVAHTSAPGDTFAVHRAANPSHWGQAAASDGASYITGPPDTAVEAGLGLTYVWKYRNRLFFIQGGTMNAWYLPLNAAGGALLMIPLSGAAKRGGSLLFGCSWSVDAGDGIDDKCCFFTDQGEVLIFTGSDPSSASAWRQEGRYDISVPKGKNGHCQLGGDVLIATVDGIVPLTAALQKDAAQLSLSAVSRNIEQTWMAELRTKDAYPWSLIKWDEGDALYVNFPGGTVGKPQTLTCGVSNLHTGAWGRFTNHDAMCFMRYRGGLFFGTQDSKIMQCESTGMDDSHWNDVTAIFDGLPYICTMVGGWEMFKVPPNQVTWFQARAAFFSAANEPFEPQLAATVDYEFRIPPPPNAGPDPGVSDVWDQGLWDVMLWDAAPPPPVPVRNTMWVSIGETGFSHAPICQVTVAQQVKPNVELLSISATFVRMGVNV